MQRLTVVPTVAESTRNETSVSTGHFRPFFILIVGDKRAVILQLPTQQHPLLPAYQHPSNSNNMVKPNSRAPKPTVVYSTTLPENLRITDPLILALANYIRRVKTLYANIAKVSRKSEGAGYPIQHTDELTIYSRPLTKYIIMAINYRQHLELPVSPHEMKDAALIEEMNAFLNKTMEATEFMLTANLSRPEIVTPMREINAIIFAKNIVKFKRTLYSKEVLLTIHRLKVFGFDCLENLGFRQKG
ncbi:hypothetical protein FPQ18DRAFT_420936 [Pyronema domesticum]|nr:hypothetical protein FPQ18DRAFT_420936 [Pyronema domesticum]